MIRIITLFLILALNFNSTYAMKRDDHSIIEGRAFTFYTVFSVLYSLTNNNFAITQHVLNYLHLLNPFCFHYDRNIDQDISDEESVFNTDPAFLTFKRSLPDLRTIEIERKRAKKMTIVGAGPVGLLEALLSYEAGFEVTLLEARTSYDRLQVIVVESRNLYYLQHFLGEEAYKNLQERKILEFDSNANQNWYIKISDLEMVLAAAVERNALSSKGRLKVFYGHRFKSTGYDDNQDLVAINKQGRVYTVRSDIIIGCDARKSELAKVMQSEFVTISKKPVYTVYVIFDNTKLEGIALKPGEWVSNVLGFPQDEGTTQHFIDLFQKTGGILASGSIFYFSEELSLEEYKSYLRATNKEDWAIQRAKSVFRIYQKVDEKILSALIPLKGVNHAIAFPIEIQRRENFAARKQIRGKDVEFYLSGDSAHTTHYYSGSGFNRGADDAYMVMISLVLSDDSVACYEKFMQLGIETHLISKILAVNSILYFGIELLRHR